MLVYGVDKKKRHENGARTLGRLAEKHLVDVVEKHYPNGTFITFAGYRSRETTQGQVIIMWHLNSPTELAIEHWKKANYFYPNAIYLVNSKILYKELIKIYDRIYFLPRFIDPEELPKPIKNKKNDTLWFGNVWEHHKDKFENYLRNTKMNYWISKNIYSIGKFETKNKVNHKEALDIVNNTKKVWAIGLCAMEAKHLGCEVVEYDNNNYEVIYPRQAREQLDKILKTEKSIKPT